MTDDKPTDYAAIIRTANAATPNPPDWLQQGKRIHSPQYGIGEVISLLGNRLIVKFPGSSTPVQFKDWSLSVQSGEIDPEHLAPISPEILPDEIPQSTSRVSFAEIQAIPQLQFRAIATQLAEITAVEITPPSTGEVYPIPKDLPTGLHKALKQIGINSLYSHQVEALTQLRMGKDLSVVTPTASGKTLCYNPAILESCLNNPETSALYIFPLKALALDQLRKLQQMVAALPSGQQLRVGLVTGDTALEDRKQLFIPAPPHILAVSPDLLHYQLEKVRRAEEWEPWREFLRRLRWVVIDESHTYIGAFGAHFANLMRRLRRAVDSVGGTSTRLQFICSSATIGNPAEMAQRFSGRTEQPERLHLIERSGAGSAGRTILCLAPSSVANPDACKIILSWLQHDLSGIVFCNSRAAVKNLLGLIQRETNRLGVGYLAQKVAAFYGSLKGDRRRDLIDALRTGRLKVILSTSALEAGIDLPELDCCLVRGYPGSIMSFRQRIGRAGRRNPGLVIFLPVAQSPLDYYYGCYPLELLSGEVESAAFNPNYPTILSKHLECTCVESGLPLVEVDSRFGSRSGAIADGLLQQDKIWLSSTGLLWGRGYPHKGINLRGSAQDSIELVDKNTDEIFEEMPRDIAYREVFTGAIYTANDSQGSMISYRCDNLNIELKKAFLTPLRQESEIFTQAETDLEIKLLEPLEEPRIIPTAFPEGRLRLTLGWGEITSLVSGYKLLTREYGLTCTNAKCRNYRQPLKGRSCSACGRPLQSAEITKVKQEVAFEQPYQTQYQAPVVKVEVNKGVVKAVSAEVNRLKESIKAQYGDNIPNSFKDLWVSAPQFVALHSIGHQIIFAVPLVVLSSSHDVSCVVEKEPEHIVGYFFDTCDSGNGASEAIFQQLPKFAAKAKSLAHACSCDYGCPRCLTQHGCPHQNAGLHKAVGLSLLDAICEGN